MSYGSYTTTQQSTAKLEISLLLKPSAALGPRKRLAEDLDEDSTKSSSQQQSTERAISAPPAESRRTSDPSYKSASTTPSLATTNTSRQPSLAPLSTPDTGRVSMEVSTGQRPVLPPLRASPPIGHLSNYHSHHASSAYLNPHYQGHPSAHAYPPTKRQRTLSPPSQAPTSNMTTQITTPAKRQSKWTPEEDAVIIELRGSGMKWEDISRKLPGRSAISCRLHYQNYLERRSEWDEEKKNRLARLYERLKADMWSKLAAELGIPWRAAEAMHWQIGESQMANRAGVTPFSLAGEGSTTRNSSQQLSVTLAHRHQRGHSDPPFDSMYSPPRYSYSRPDHRSYHHPQQQQQHQHQHQPPPPPTMTSEKEEIVRLTHPSTPLPNLSPGEQSHRLLPSMAELDQSVTAAALANSRQNSVSSRR